MVGPLDGRARRGRCFPRRRFHLDQIAFSLVLIRNHTSPDSGKRQHKSRAWSRQFDPVLGASGWPTSQARTPRVLPPREEFSPATSGSNRLFNRRDLNHTSPDSGKHQHKSRAYNRLFDPALRAGGRCSAQACTLNCTKSRRQLPRLPSAPGRFRPGWN